MALSVNETVDQGREDYCSCIVASPEELLRMHCRQSVRLTDLRTIHKLKGEQWLRAAAAIGFHEDEARKIVRLYRNIDAIIEHCENNCVWLSVGQVLKLFAKPRVKKAQAASQPVDEPPVEQEAESQPVGPAPEAAVLNRRIAELEAQIEELRVQFYDATGTTCIIGRE